MKEIVEEMDLLKRKGAEIRSWLGVATYNFFEGEFKYYPFSPLRSWKGVWGIA